MAGKREKISQMSSEVVDSNPYRYVNETDTKVFHLKKGRKELIYLIAYFYKIYLY